MTVLNDARRLYDLGFAIIWIHPKSKRPVESGWTTGERSTWAELEAGYRRGYNVGVRTGKPSRIQGLYLTCIDVDVKDPSYRAAALTKLRELLPKGDVTLPEVRSGSGNGSRHLYCLSKTHFKMITYVKEKDRFEICIYSDGRQMVLPPSIHPTGRAYIWAVPISKHTPLAEMDFSAYSVSTESYPGKKKKPTAAAATDDFDFTPSAEAAEEADFGFTPVDVDIDWLPISEKVLKGIKNGDGVADRSAFLLPAATALHSAGLGQSELLSVLTDTDHYLGSTAYDHAQTKDRTAAARWLWKYTVQRIFSERSPVGVFAKPAETRTLSPEEEAKQTEEILSTLNWRKDLVRGGQYGDGAVKPLTGNVVLILKNDVCLSVVVRDDFAFRDTYGCDTPWGGKKGDAIVDDDVANIKYWLGRRWGFEPGKDIIYDALTVIACQNTKDPVRDALDALPAWDQTPRLDGWLKNHFEAEGDDEYLAQVFRKWMCAMVLRVYKPGAKFDWMPIFEGKQGVGKSSFGRILVGDKYFLDWLPNLNDKDSAIALQGVWGVEMGELSQFRKNELENIKAFITRTVDRLRPPYGRKMIEYARRCVFFGTTNRTTYLIDDSGNRRFKPIMVGELDFAALRRDRLQLFAEAKWLLDTGKETELTLDLTGRAKIFEADIHQEKRVEDDSFAMEEAMLEFAENVLEKRIDFNLKKFGIIELFRGEGSRGPLSKWAPNNRNQQFAAKMLKKLGGRKRAINGRNFWEIDFSDRFNDRSKHDPVTEKSL
jgi:predicted P-loop ATPase